MSARPGRARIPADAIRSARDLAPLIDHTILRDNATAAHVAAACEEARAHGFAGVCVRGALIGEAARRLAGTSSLPIAVADFPLGEGTTAARSEEVRLLVARGAREVDVVAPLPAVLAGDWRRALEDLATVIAAAGPVAVKVILETAKLTREGKAAVAAIAKAAGAAFVKTSTGYGGGGATMDDVALLRAVVGDEVGVKASGGIRTAADALAMVRAGASRIGSSASVAIVTGSIP